MKLASEFFKGMLAVSILSLALTSCTNKQSDTVASTEKAVEKSIRSREVNTTILTKEMQDKLTPENVIKILEMGNQEFMSDSLTIRNNSARVREAASGQYPKAAVLSCLDSRVPVEDVFHLGIGDLFVARVAGNIINEDMLGSLEYACKVSGSKVVVVLGHGSCGAIKSAIDDVELGNITALLAKIRPAVEAAGKDYKGEKTSKNPEFVELVCRKNIDLMVEDIRTKSPILKEMEAKGEIKIVGANYNIETGKVVFYQN